MENGNSGTEIGVKGVGYDVLLRSKPIKASLRLAYTLTKDGMMD